MATDTDRIGRSALVRVVSVGLAAALLCALVLPAIVPAVTAQGQGQLAQAVGMM